LECLVNPKPCSRCRTTPASTIHTSYCKACRAAYQRAWRARRKGEPFELAEPELPAEPALRLRATPTRQELARLRLL
jgi:hypothetical protein